MLAITIEALIKIAILLGGRMTAAAYLVLLERWIAAWVQDRIGPNRVSVLPKDLGIEGAYNPIPLIVAPRIDVGMVYVFAVSSIAVYGVILGGWASNSKYSFLGGLRSSAQLIAYEIPLGLGILGVILVNGSLRLDTIIGEQAQTGFWNALVQPLGFFVFVVAAFAESARLPFDLPEAEQELIGGYHTEYAGMKLLLFLIAEFLHMITASFLIVILFQIGRASCRERV